MECDSYFSLSNLGGYSYEREVAQTTLCVSNTLKAAIFIVGIVAFIALFLVAITFLIKDLRNGAQTYRKIFLCGMSFGCLTETIALIVFLCGVDHRARFILTPLPFMGSTVAAKELIGTWYDLVTQITAFQEHRNKGFYGRFHMLINVSSSSYFIGYFVIWGVFPIIFVVDPFAMNIVYTAMMSFASIVGIVQVILFYIATVKLLKLYKTGAEFRNGSDSVDGVIQRLEKSKELCFKFFFPATLPLFFFPIWLFVTRTPTNPGLQGNFYWHFIVMGVTKWSSFAALLFIIIKVVRPSGAGSSAYGGSTPATSSAGKRVSSAEPKEKEIKGFPSFSVEELVGS